MKYLRPATGDDIEVIVQDMRKEDVTECAAVGHTPRSALLHGLEQSDVAFTLLDPDGVPAGMIGIASGALPKWGLIWLLGTDRIPRNPIKLLRRCKPFLELMFQEYDVLYNLVHANNWLHIKWLRWLGFTIINQTREHNGHKFHEFYKVKD
jgi:hypothetical protein